MKLARLEQELAMARRQQVRPPPRAPNNSGEQAKPLLMSSDPPLQGAHATGGLLAPPVDPRVAAFEMEYARWVEDQKKQAAELRAAL